ncbi:CopG family ribbon-helix-helix protein [Pseudomonas sp. OTU5201]|uniref:CopG family ribbon-helix-helix protein n=1 Tax=Pseudomonas sp. OTU5201 TaxID=3043850 RepID=UPI00313DD72D
MSVAPLNLPDDIAARLAKLAKATGRSTDTLAQEALSEYIRRESWQIDEVQQAVKEADEGDFATPEEVRAILEKWNGNAY